VGMVAERPEPVVDDDLVHCINETQINAENSNPETPLRATLNRLRYLRPNNRVSEQSC